MMYKHFIISYSKLDHLSPWSLLLGHILCPHSRCHVNSRMHFNHLSIQCNEIYIWIIIPSQCTKKKKIQLEIPSNQPVTVQKILFDKKKWWRNNYYSSNKTNSSSVCSKRALILISKSMLFINSPLNTIQLVEHHIREPKMRHTDGISCSL